MGNTTMKRKPNNPIWWKSPCCWKCAQFDEDCNVVKCGNRFKFYLPIKTCDDCGVKCSQNPVFAAIRKLPSRVGWRTKR